MCAHMSTIYSVNRSITSNRIELIIICMFSVANMHYNWIHYHISTVYNLLCTWSVTILQIPLDWSVQQIMWALSNSNFPGTWIMNLLSLLVNWTPSVDKLITLILLMLHDGVKPQGLLTKPWTSAVFPTSTLTSPEGLVVTVGNNMYSTYAWYLSLFGMTYIINSYHAPLYT